MKKKTKPWLKIEAKDKALNRDPKVRRYLAHVADAIMREVGLLELMRDAWEGLPAYAGPIPLVVSPALFKVMKKNGMAAAWGRSLVVSRSLPSVAEPKRRPLEKRKAR